MNITAERLRELRVRLGMSQENVAQALGITRTAYNKYEQGVIEPTRKLRELQKLFGVSTDYILGRTDNPVPIPPYTSEQVQKYLDLSEHGRSIVDITLDAVYNRENPSSKQIGRSLLHKKETSQ